MDDHDVENVGGTVRFVDAQTGSVDASRYFDRGFNTSCVRLDDLPVPHNVTRVIIPAGQR